MGFRGGVCLSAPFDCVLQSFNFGIEETFGLVRAWLGWFGGGRFGSGSIIPSTPLIPYFEFFRLYVKAFFFRYASGLMPMESGVRGRRQFVVDGQHTMFKSQDSRSYRCFPRGGGILI